MTTCRRLLGALLGPAAVAGVVLPALLTALLSALLLVSAPAHADETTERALKFNDSAEWVTTIDKDLFAVSKGVWGPQGRFADITVRNRAEVPADIDVLIDRAGGDDPSDNPLSFQVQVDDEAWFPLSSVETGRTISLPQVESHGTVVIRVQALLRASAAADRELSPADGTFEVSVLRSSAATIAGSGESQGASNLYLAPFFLVVALLLLSALSVRRRLDRRTT